MGAAGAAAEGAPTVDGWSEKDQRIIVSAPADGYLFDLLLHAKLDGSPRQIYNILVDPDSPRIFRGIKQVLSRETLEDDGRGRRKLRVGHRALTKFLWLSVTFDTQLLVWEDDNDMTVTFTNARQDGFMRKFEGRWQVRPFSQATLDDVFKQQQQQQQSQHHHHHHHHQQQQQQQSHHHRHLGLPFWHHQGASQPPSALVSLEQALAPRATPPRPLQPLVRGLCGRVLQNMMADLRCELQRQQQAKAAGSDGGKHGGSSSSSSSAGKGCGGAAGARMSSQQDRGASLPVASLTVGTPAEAPALPSWQVVVRL